MNLVVDQEKCIGCGACVAISPENFDFNDEGLSKVISKEITDTTRDAVEACPVYAIEITEAETEIKQDKESNCTCDECQNEEEHECCHKECKCSNKKIDEIDVMDEEQDKEDVSEEEQEAA